MKKDAGFKLYVKIKGEPADKETNEVIFNALRDANLSTDSVQKKYKDKKIDVFEVTMEFARNLYRAKISLPILFEIYSERNFSLQRYRLLEPMYMKKAKFMRHVRRKKDKKQEAKEAALAEGKGKGSFVVTGHLSAIVGTALEEIIKDFYYIFPEVRESHNVRELLLGYSEENIKKRLMEQYSQAEVNDMEIEDPVELLGFEDYRITFFKETEGIGRELPKELDKFLKKKKKRK